eukprot:PRCOL_00006666-RA
MVRARAAEPKAFCPCRAAGSRGRPRLGGTVWAAVVAAAALTLAASARSARASLTYKDHLLYSDDTDNITVVGGVVSPEGLELHTALGEGKVVKAEVEESIGHGIGEAKQLVRYLPDGFASARAIAFSPDGAYLFLAGADSDGKGRLAALARNGLGELRQSQVVTYDVRGGDNRSVCLANPTSLAVSPDGHDVYFTTDSIGDSTWAAVGHLRRRQGDGSHWPGPAGSIAVELITTVMSTNESNSDVKIQDGAGLDSSIDISLYLTPSDVRDGFPPYDRWYQLVWEERSKLTASDAGQGDNFGNSVAISDDAKTAIVTAYAGSGVGLKPGSAYVFVRPTTGTDATWSEEARLNATDGARFDYFGASSAITADGSTVLIGATGCGPGGCAYVFERSGGAWTQQAKLVASDEQTSDNFGYAVALSAKYAVVGAPRHRHNGLEDAGATYVFHRDGSTWSVMKKLVASSPEKHDRFGHSLALYKKTIVVGTNNRFTGSTSQDPTADPKRARAYIFRRSPGGTEGNWSHEANLTVSDQAGGDFEVAVAAHGDTVAVGVAPHKHAYHFNASSPGSVHIFVRAADATWRKQDIVRAFDPNEGDRFGYSVALFGDTLLVGAPSHWVWGPASGSAYAYDRNGTEWRYKDEITTDYYNGAASDNFGHAVALAGDTAVIGAFHDKISQRVCVRTSC